MAIDKSAAGPRDATGLLEWLDEQRQQDHERLVQFARELEQIRGELRDQSATITHVEAAATTRASVAESRSTDDSTTRLFERLALIERAFDEHAENQSRASQAETALGERERRQVSELILQVDNLARNVDAAHGRSQALSEEIRHERDALTPITQALEEVQRTSAATISRLAAMEQTTRRLAAMQALFEQNVEKRGSDLSRIDNQLKLIDLRVTRELADVRKFVDEARGRIDDALRPVESLNRQVAEIIQEREALQLRTLEIGQSVDQLADSLSRLEAQGRSDRLAGERLGDGQEALSRRLESTSASIWQLGERLNVLVDELGQVRADVRGVRELTDALLRRAEKSDDDRRRLEATQTKLEADQNSARTEARQAIEKLNTRLDSELDTLQFGVDGRKHVAIDHLRRTVAELSQQLRELEADGAGP